MNRLIGLDIGGIASTTTSSTIKVAEVGDHGQLLWCQAILFQKNMHLYSMCCNDYCRYASPIRSIQES